MTPSRTTGPPPPTLPTPESPDPRTTLPRSPRPGRPARSARQPRRAATVSARSFRVDSETSQIVPSERGRRRNPFRRGFRIRRERHRDPPRILVNRCCGGAILRRTTGRGGPRPWVRRRRRDFRRQRDRPDARSVGERRSCRPAPMPGPGPCVSSALEVVVPAAGPAGLPTEGPIRQRVLGLALGRRSVGPRGGLGLGRCGGKPEPIGSNPLANICTMPGILYADRQNACRSAYSVQLPRECLCLEVASGRLLAACGRSGWPSGLPRCRWLSRRRHPRRRGEGGRR